MLQVLSSRFVSVHVSGRYSRTEIIRYLFLFVEREIYFSIAYRCTDGSLVVAYDVNIICEPKQHCATAKQSYLAVAQSYHKSFSRTGRYFYLFEQCLLSASLAQLKSSRTLRLQDPSFLFHQGSLVFCQSRSVGDA